MRNKKDKELSPCIVSWAKFSLNIKTEIPENSKKCSLDYWRDVINTILSCPKYYKYIINKESAINSFDYVCRL